ncbi:lysophospholipid acyltransferase family protein [Miltoncostaea marina]|uniref:lysophospholipid acyltransferase family protein n=1 Tax=Miltoncostaea marina TaxID=2843215 RepID=UPI001C3CBFD5|nr:lysophospholipid acyltransferase family protein [Miltoncostaea marina]
MSDPADEVHWRPVRGGVWAPIWWFGRVLLWVTAPWLLGYRAAGRRRVPREGGVLVIANHLADIDPPALAMAVMPRRAEYLADARHFTRRWLATLLFALGAFPVRLDRSDLRALRHARERLQAGGLVIVWPEGTPSWGPRMGPFREGAGHLALTPGVTVLPAAIWGTHKVLRGRRPVGRGPVLVAIGEPLPVPAEGPSRERARAVVEQARAEIERLLEPMVRAHP